jgi:hypothetical protein
VALRAACFIRRKCLRQPWDNRLDLLLPVFFAIVQAPFLHDSCLCSTQTRSSLVAAIGLITLSSMSGGGAGGK